MSVLSEVLTSRWAQKRRDLEIEWILGLVIPVLVSGLLCMASHSRALYESTLIPPSDYTVQEARFEVVGGFGCQTAGASTIPGIVLIYSWSVIPPLVSIVVYYRESRSCLWDVLDKSGQVF